MTLAKVFNIPINDLLSDEGTPETVSDSGEKLNFIHSKKNNSHIYELSDKEKALVGCFRVCTLEQQNNILSYINKNIVKNNQDS